MNEPAPKLLSMHQISKRVGVSITHVKRLAKAGAFGEKVKVGVRAVRFKEDQVKDFLKSRSQARRVDNYTFGLIFPLVARWKSPKQAPADWNRLARAFGRKGFGSQGPDASDA